MIIINASYSWWNLIQSHLAVALNAADWVSFFVFVLLSYPCGQTHYLFCPRVVVSYDCIMICVMLFSASARHVDFVI